MLNSYQDPIRLFNTIQYKNKGISKNQSYKYSVIEQ